MKNTPYVLVGGIFMAFKIYFNKKTGHPSISLSGKDKTKWENLEMTHHPRTDDKYIEIVCISNRKESTSYVRKYIRKDKYGVKGRKMNNHKLTDCSECKVKTYLKEKNKN